MNDWQPLAISRLLLDVGKLAMSRFQALKSDDVEVKEDNTLVTTVDREIEQQIGQELVRPSQNVYLIGEESHAQQDGSYYRKALQHVAWVLDPIDGTLPFAHGLPFWGISLGFMNRGVIQQGALFLPVFGTLLITCGEHNRYKNFGCDPQYWQLEDEQQLQPIVPYSSSNSPKHQLLSIPQDMAKAGRYRGRHHVQAIGSCVYSIAQFLFGAYSGYVAIAKLWDICGSLALLHRHGAALRFRNRQTVGMTVDQSSYYLDFDKPNSWLLRDLLFIAPDEQSCNYLIDHAEPR